MLESSGLSPTADPQEQLRAYAATRDPALRDAIVLAFGPLVEKIARRYATYGESADDLIQEGYIGLIKAVDQFDPDKGVKFTTYATHIISGEIRHYLRDLGTLIKEPAWLQEQHYRVQRAMEILTQRLGRPPEIDEVASHMNMREQEVADILRSRMVFRVDSIDDSGAEGDFDLLSTYDPEMVKTGRPGSESRDVEDRIFFREAIAQLKPLEQQCILGFFYGQRTKTEIARELGISINYVSYLVKRGLRRLRETVEQSEHEEALPALATMEEKVAVLEPTPAPQQTKDPVTGFRSRRQFERTLREEFARSRRYPQEFAVLFVRLATTPDDHQLWRSYVTDDVLQTIAQCMARSLRVVDKLYRYSDRLFLAILPHTGQQAEIAANRVNGAIAELMGSIQPAPPTTMRVITAQVSAPEDGASGRELMKHGMALVKQMLAES